MVEVRTYEPSDRAALLDLFGRVGEGSPTASLWGHPESEAAIYLTPYITYEPEHLFLALADGGPVGYLAGCADSTDFPAESTRIDAAIREYRLIVRRRPAAFFARALRDTALAKLRRVPTAGDFDDQRWPAHLHINLAPEARGTGAAEQLMTAWQAELRAIDSPGCYLQTLVENTRAVRFFTRMGFTAYGPAPLVPGLRYEGGPVHQRTMVWST